MICQATYDSLEAIPEALRDEFHQVNGRWELKADAIPGVGPLFNKALAANEQKAVGQVKTRNERIRALEEENNSLKDRIATVDIPGAKILSPEDAKTFDALVALGTPKEIKEKLDKLPELEGQVAKVEMAKSIGEVAAAGGINTDVLTDWAMSSEASHLKFFTKTVEQSDTKGVKTEVQVPYVRIEKSEGGKTKVEEKELLPFAKEALPEWKYAALTAVPEAGKVQSPARPTGPAGVKIPDLGSARKASEAGANRKRPVEIANEQRAARPSPFAPKAAAPVPTTLPTGFAK